MVLGVSLARGLHLLVGWIGGLQGLAKVPCLPAVLTRLYV